MRTKLREIKAAGDPSLLRMAWVQARQWAPHGSVKREQALRDLVGRLVALHFAGMRPGLRDKARDDFLRAVDELVPECEKAIFPDGLPAEWGAERSRRTGAEEPLHRRDHHLADRPPRQGRQ
jgi:hypothetical protein